MVTDLNVIRHKLKGLRRRARAAITPRGRIENYQSEFAESARVFQNYLRSVDFNFPPATGKPIGVILAPIVGTPAPWFFAMIAIGLRRHGRNVILIYDDVDFEFPSAVSYFQMQQKYIAQVVERLAPHFPIRRLSEVMPEPLQTDDSEHLDWLVALNMRWWRRAGPITPNLKNVAERERHCLEEHLARTYGLLAQVPFDSIVTVGGLIGQGASFLRAARRHDTRFVTCDGSFGCLLVCPDGNAALQSDLTPAFRAFWETSAPSEITFAIESAKREFALRSRGQDKKQFQTQTHRGASALQAEVVITLNVEWDSSALGRHVIFQDSGEWLRESVEFILNQNKSVIVRQHPSERHVFAKSDFDPPTLLGPEICANPNFHFVAAGDPVNTYDLLETTKLVLTYVSTIGIEAAAMGKNVIAVGNSYYAPLGFVYAPKTRAEYFARIAQGLDNRLPTLPNQQERAWVMYYLGQVCNRVFTDFTPQPPDFWRWVRRTPKTLLNDVIYQRILTAIEQNVPMSLLNHENRWKQQA